MLCQPRVRRSYVTQVLDRPDQRTRPRSGCWASPTRSARATCATCSSEPSTAAPDSCRYRAGRPGAPATSTEETAGAPAGPDRAPLRAQRRLACLRSVLDPGIGIVLAALSALALALAGPAGRPRRRQGGQRLQEAQPRLGHRRRCAHHRRQPRQPVGPGLRAGDARVGGRQRHRRLDAVLRRRAQEHPGDPAARGRHPGRRSDRDGLQRHRRLQGRRRSRRTSSSTPRPGRSPPGTRARTAVTEATTPGRRSTRAWPSRARAARRCSTPRTSTRARSTSSTTSFAPVTVPGGFADPNLPAGFAPFNVQEIAGRLVVAYAQQDADAEDERRAARASATSTSSTRSGHLLRRLISQGAAERAVGPGGRPAALRAVQRRPARRQLRRRGDQRLRPADGRLPRHAAEQGRQPDQDQRPLGAALRQRRDRHAADAPVHRRASATRTTASSARSSSAAAASSPDRLTAAGSWRSPRPGAGCP